SADRLVRYLVLDDDSSLTGEGVRFIEVGAAMRGRPQARQLPAPAYAWLDETIAAWFRRNPSKEHESLCVSRERAENLLDQLRQVHASREPAAGTEALEAITRDLIAWLEDPANATEPLSLLRRRLSLSTGDVLTFLICLAPELNLNYQL